MRRLPGLPPSPPNADPATRQWMDAVSEALAVQVGQRGDPLDRAVTFRDMGGAFVFGTSAGSGGGGGTGTGGGGGDDEVLTPPPAPVNFQADVNPVSVVLTHEKAPVDFIAFTEFFRSDDAIFANATLIGVSPGQTFFDSSVQHSQTYYYWARYRSYADIVGPLHDIEPISVTTLDNTQDLLEQLENRLDFVHLTNTLADPIEKIPGIESGLAGEISERINKDIELGEDVAGEIANRIAAINSEQTARVAADDELDGKITSQAGRVDTVIADLSDETTARIAAINSEQTARVAADQALASDITTFQSTLDGQAASIQQLTQTSVQLGDDLVSLKAQYTLKLDVDGYVSGYSAINDGSTSSFLFRTDTFAVGSPGKQSLSFVVDGDRVVIDGADIQQATITDAAIANLSVDKLVGATGSFVEANIGEGSITNAMIGFEIKSDNFVPGQSGWRISKSGDADFIGARVAGNIVGSYIRGSVIEGSVIITSNTSLTAATEADGGPGTIRYLHFLDDNPFSVSSGAGTPPVLTVYPADYTASGTVLYGEGVQQEVYKELFRYPRFLATPTVTAVFSGSKTEIGSSNNVYYPTPRIGARIILYKRGVNGVGVEVLNTGLITITSKNSTTLYYSWGRIEVSSVSKSRAIDHYQGSGSAWYRYTGSRSLTFIIDTKYDYRGDYTGFYAVSSSAYDGLVSSVLLEDRLSNYF